MILNLINFFYSDDDLQAIPQAPRKAVQACDKIKKINLLGIDFHILNGNRTEVGEFPHQVVLGYLDEVDSSKPASWDCGGSLISRVSNNLKDFTFKDHM